MFAGRFETTFRDDERGLSFDVAIHWERWREPRGFRISHTSVEVLAARFLVRRAINSDGGKPVEIWADVDPSRFQPRWFAHWYRRDIKRLLAMYVNSFTPSLEVAHV